MFIAAILFNHLNRMPINCFEKISLKDWKYYFFRRYMGEYISSAVLKDSKFVNDIRVLDRLFKGIC